MYTPFWRCNVYIAGRLGPQHLNPEYRYSNHYYYVSRALTILLVLRRHFISFLLTHYPHVRSLQVIQNPVNQAGSCGVSTCNCGDSYVPMFDSQR